jgi:hypothetical protein
MNRLFGIQLLVMVMAACLGSIGALSASGSSDFTSLPKTLGVVRPIRFSKTLRFLGGCNAGQGKGSG